MLKKILISFLLACYLLVSFSTAAHAQTWYNQSFQEWYSKVHGGDQSEIFGERYTAAQVQWVIYGFISFIINLPGNSDANACLLTPGRDLLECKDLIIKSIENITSKSPTGSKDDLNKTAWYQVFTNRPVSGIEYFRDVFSHLGLVPEAKAQGFGFSAANPVLVLWKVSRDISYLLLIIAIIIMSFMIMFRVKISPQTVITVQSALPKVIIALVLITFSYAIAGLLIDLMYVIMGLISALLVNSHLTKLSWSEIFGTFTTNENVFTLLIAYWFEFFVASFLSIFTWSTGAIAGFVLFLFSIIAIFILLWNSIKIIALLLKTYVKILLLILVAPFQILTGTVVQGAGFGSWLRSMAAELAVYPVMTIMFFLAFLFLGAGMPDWFPRTIFGVGSSTLSGTPWNPPLTLGTGGTNTSQILWVITSFVIISLIPKTADIIQALISGKPFAYGTAIGEALGPARATAGFGVAGGAGYVGGRIAANVPAGWQRGTVQQITEAVQRWAARGFGG